MLKSAISTNKLKGGGSPTPTPTPSFECKMITYVGNGATTNEIEFENEVHGYMFGNCSDAMNCYISWLQTPHDKIDFMYTGATKGTYRTPCSWSDNNKKLTISGENADVAFNSNGNEYYLFYF